jgi:hypothetical protein
MADTDLVSAATKPAAPSAYRERLEKAFLKADELAQQGDKQAAADAKQFADELRNLDKGGGAGFDAERQRLATSPRKIEKTLAGNTWADLGSDLGKTIISKPLEGIVKTPGIAGDLGSLAKLGRDYAVTKFTDTPWEEQRKQPFLGMSQADLDRYGSEAFKKSAEETTGIKFHDPETRVGQVLGGGLEFAGGALVPIPGVSGVRAAVRGAETLAPAIKAGARHLGKEAALYGAVPGSLAELGGILTEGEKYEPWARGAIALGAGGTAAVASARSKMEKDLLSALTPQQLDDTEKLFRLSIEQKTPITRAEAAQLISKGGTNLADVQRWVEGSGNARMQRFMAARGDQLRSAQEEIFGRTLGQPATETSLIGGRVRDAAEEVIADTPQARGVTRAEGAIPPLSPERSGNVIQPELVQTRQGLEGARAAEAGVNYPAAFAQTPATIPQPRLPGGTGPALGQVDTTGALAQVKALQTNEKGEIAAALKKAEEVLYRADQPGVLEHSLQGLQASHREIGRAISAAEKAGDGTTVSRLMDVQKQIEQTLEASPLYKQATERYAEQSRPLDPFSQGPFGAVTEKKPFTGEPVMPPSAVPGHIQKAGPEAAQALVDTVTPAAPAAREMGDFLAADILKKTGGNPAAIRAALDGNDAIKRFPDAVTRLTDLAAAREALETARSRGPLAGLLKSKHPETTEAVNTLLGNPNISPAEMKITMEKLAAKNPRAAAELLRFHLDHEFAKARDVSRTSSYAQQVSGAVWAQAIGGNEEAKGRLLAGVEAVHGPGAAKGMQDFITVLTAMGERQGVGSRTSFNLQYAKDMEAGNLVTAGVKALIDAPTKLGFLKGVKDRWDNLTRAGNEDKIARLLTDPAAAAEFRALAEGGGSVARATRAVAKISYLMDRITREEEGGQPLRFTVRARREPAQ